MSLTNAPLQPHPDNHYNDEGYHFLKDGHHYFRYRLDRYNNRILRATLFSKSIAVVHDIRVTCYEHIVEKTHEQVKECFESFLKL